MNSRAVIGFVFIAAMFSVFAIGNIYATMDPYDFRDPGPPPALNYRPVPPSCCGDSICLLEDHDGR